MVACSDFGRVEELEDRLRKAREITQHFNQSLSRDETRLGESYLKNETNIAFRYMGGAARNYGVVFEAVPSWRNFGALGSGIGANHDCRWPSINGKKSAVFPRYVEFVQHEEKIIPSFVRLEIFDDQAIGLRKPLYLFSSPVSRVIEGSDTLPEWKIDICWTRCAVALGERDREHIQTTSDAMNDDPSLGIDDVWDGLHVSEANKFLSRLRIEITEECVRGITFPSVNLAFQDWEIGYGPVDGGLSV